MSLVTDDRQVLAHVARRFYAGGETKSEIAEELGLSRFRIARLLDEAVRTGVVRFEIDEPVPVADELARRLRDETSVRAAVVVAGDDPLDLARAAAAWLPQLLAPGETIAVGWGSTLMSVVAALGADDLRLGGRVVQACGGGVGLEPGSSGPDEAATLLAARLGATSMRLPAPALMDDRAGRDALLANPAVRPTVALFEAVTTVLVGIGAFEAGRSALVRSGFVDAPTLARLRRRGAVGDLLLYPFDDAGTIVGSGLEERAIVLPLAVLRSARVIAVAGGSGKEGAVAAAIRTGLVDVLVTDARCAAASLGASS
jgi:DNA-binding transcriptional regulator LsrR (DeoR family)